MAGKWTVQDLYEAMLRQGEPDDEVTFIDLVGNELPFRWMHGRKDRPRWERPGVTIRLNVDGGTVYE